VLDRLMHCITNHLVSEGLNLPIKRARALKTEFHSARKKGERQYLDDSQTHNLFRSLNEHFQTKVSIARIRMGNRQELETLINEEASLLGMHLRDERKSGFQESG